MHGSLAWMAFFCLAWMLPEGRGAGRPPAAAQHASPVFIRLEAEDAVDYSFIPGFAPMKVGEAGNRELSNGRCLLLNAAADPFPGRTHQARYELAIAEDGTYDLVGRLGLQPADEQSFELRWRMDHEPWRSLDLPPAMVVRAAVTIPTGRGGMRVAPYRFGRATLEAGTHTLTLEVRPLGRFDGLLALDAFYVATAPLDDDLIRDARVWTPAEQLLSRIPVDITIFPDHIVTNPMPHPNRGVALYGMGNTNDGPRVKSLMQAIGVNFTRFFLYQNDVHPVPDFSSSTRAGDLARFLKTRGVDDPDGWMTQASRDPAVVRSFAGRRDLLQYLEDERITFDQPGDPNWEPLERFVRGLSRDDQPLKALVHTERMPLWLSEHPARQQLQNSAIIPVPEALLYPPNNARAYEALWDQCIRYCDEAFPDLVAYWEVHNEPNLDDFFQVTWPSGPKTEAYKDRKINAYLRMYSAAATAARKAARDSKIGGPALAGADPVWISRLARHCADNKLKLDFVSWHMYDYQPVEVENAIQDFRAILHTNGFQHSELIISEWNIHGSGGQSAEQRRRFNGTYNAALATATLAAMVRAGLDQALFFYDRDQNDTANFGLLAPDARKKPVYFAFDLFHRLGDVQVQIDQSSYYRIGSLATRAGQQLLLLLWNYDPEETTERSVRLFIEGARVGRAKRYLIDATHSKLGDEAVALVGTGSSISEVSLRPNSVMLIEMTLAQDGK